jgi:hypothetical protein
VTKRDDTTTTEFRMSGEAGRRPRLPGEIARGCGQGAVRHRPTELGPFDGRHAKGERPNGDGRYAVAEGLAKSAIVMSVRMARRLMSVLTGMRRLQADFIQTLKVDSMRRGDAVRKWRESLHGQRQSE